MFGCKSDGKINESEDKLNSIQGSWELSKAYRNNSPTTTLDGAYFKVNDDNLQTNVLGQDDNSGYTFSGDTIYQHDSVFGPVPYSVGSLSDTSMSLFTSLRGVRFELEFMRSE